MACLHFVTILQAVVLPDTSIAETTLESRFLDRNALGDFRGANYLQ
jgi:hypothetical protein